jgi:hypothetical protein
MFIIGLQFVCFLLVVLFRSTYCVVNTSMNYEKEANADDQYCPPSTVTITKEPDH